MDTKKERQAVPPYIPYKTFRTLIESLRATSIPARIDRSVFPSMSGGMQTNVFAGLKYLGLIDDKHVPQDGLGRLVAADGEAWRETLRKVFDAAYAPVFQDGLTLSNATSQQLCERLTNLGASGGTVRKCVLFLTAMAKDAGMEVSPHLGKRPKRGNAEPRAYVRRAKKAKGPEPQQEPKPASEGASLWSKVLLDKFPEFNPGWSAEVQSQWFASFARLMNMAEGKEK